jgi:predicted enzyme related to lactoylglutathione lyase
MSNSLSHFMIHADDVERARRFYERTFGWRFEAWGPPDFYLIHTGKDDAAVHGSVAKRDEPVVGRGMIGFECTIAVDDLAAARRAIQANGGKILLDEHEIVGVGRLVRFEDTEGNVVCAMRYD